MLSIGMPGTPEMVIIGFIGLLLFGKRLPVLARSMGSSIIEFKKGLTHGEPTYLPEKGENYAEPSTKTTEAEET